MYCYQNFFRTGLIFTYFILVSHTVSKAWLVPVSFFPEWVLIPLFLPSEHHARCRRGCGSSASLSSLRDPQ